MKRLSYLWLALMATALCFGESPAPSATPAATTAESTALPSPLPGFTWDSLNHIAVQSRGRVKPMDTYARESAQYVTGSVFFNHFTPTELVWSWLTTYDKSWVNAQFIRIDHFPTKAALGLEHDRKYFSPTEIRALPALPKQLQAIQKKQSSREKLNELEKKIVQIQNQIGLVEAIARGEDLSIFADPAKADGNWATLAAIATGELPYSPLDQKKISDALKPVASAYVKNTPNIWADAVTNFRNELRKIGGKSYPSESSVNLEIHYNKLRPFRWAWILYLVAFISLLVAIVTKTTASGRVGGAMICLAFGMHVYGFAVRCIISGRPPVTNMYESIIWVTFGCVLFSGVIWAKYRNLVIPTAACVFAIVGLVLADNLPTVLDPGIHPLEPVLRSNFWLTIHVLTITASYAAFALSLCLGNVVLGNYLFRPQNTAWIQQLTLFMYRAVQIGVVLIAAGTILGGVWADYSWGRFWGWDPKEVWALIALLLYLAVLHGRFTGWLKGFGFTACVVICFLGVLMAWYGVNFVLGAGLHSYGFGTGGLEYVVMYVAAQLAFIGAAFLKYQKNYHRAPKSAILPKLH